jgi:hypothetical protein
MKEHDCTKCIHARQHDEHEWECTAKEYDIKAFGCYVPKMTFGDAIEALKKGAKVARRGWNGNGIYLEMQKPDEHSKMTLPYIYIVTNSLVSDNPHAPRGVVPWLASQTDMLCEDWYIKE